MFSICGKLPISISGIISRFNFATVPKSANKKVGNKNVKPEKQKFMKKQKQAASKEIAMSRRSGGNDRSASFSRALFTVQNKNLDMVDSEEGLRRKMIAKSWSRFTMLQLHKESEYDAKFLNSRIRAMKELQMISPSLAEKASQIFYDPAPITIKPAAETKPEKLPFE